MQGCINKICQRPLKPILSLNICHLHCIIRLYEKPPCCTNVIIRRTEIIYVNKREHWIAVPSTKTPMENASYSKLKVTNHVPILSSSHISVTVNSVSVNKENRREKTREKQKKTRRDSADAFKFIRRGMSY